MKTSIDRQSSLVAINNLKLVNLTVYAIYFPFLRKVHHTFTARYSPVRLAAGRCMARKTQQNYQSCILVDHPQMKDDPLAQFC